MSIKNISFENTSEFVEDSVKWYINDSVDVKISEYGEVVSLRSGCTMFETKQGNYSVYYKGLDHTHPVKLVSLMTRILGLKKQHNSAKIKLIDINKGWVFGNIVSSYKGKDVIVKSEYFDKLKCFNGVGDLVVSDTHSSMYTTYTNDSKFITEDNAIFPTKELAEWHQFNVDRGKNNAQTVLDYNGGYVLAEKIYLNDVVYCNTKPYVNFVDVMTNDKGIVVELANEYCLFDKCDLFQYGVHSLKEYTVDEAKSIERVINSIKVLQNKLDNLV